MTVARSQLVDVNLTPWYHVISKTVRGAFLLSQGEDDRKQWLQDRLRTLSGSFAVEVAGFSVLDNHLHVLLKLEPERVDTWSDEEVIRRWAKVCPPRGADRKPLAVIEDWVKRQMTDRTFVQKARERLGNLGWFMKCLKEPLARMANRCDGVSGHFWQGRYKSIAVLDDEALLATCAYIDLNPVAAGIARLPEQSAYTSIKARIAHCQSQGRSNDLAGAQDGSVSGVLLGRGIEADSWLCPIEDSRHTGSLRSGLLPDFSLGSYLLLVDYTSRLLREGKARVSHEVESIFARLATTTEVWGQTITLLLKRARPVGVTFSFDRDKLRQAARHRRCHHVANLNGCPA